MTSPLKFDVGELLNAQGADVMPEQRTQTGPAPERIGVEMIAIAREAGHRSKVAVIGHAKGLNAKGACIGPRGQRVNNIMRQLGGEKIDIIDYSEDPTVYVGNALAPSKVIKVTVLDSEEQVARVIVPDYQLSLAIGKEGQNARLAARLTGWKIDIHSDADAN